ncbi:MAG TPA: hypothetical protein VFA57_03220 [Pseudolabrys sp.]|nr:hypothetical protein [Pseudolabrys sp.]
MSAPDTHDVFAELNAIMDRLMQAIKEETERARAGKLKAAAEIAESKRQLAKLYAAESERVQARLPEQPGAAIATLRTRHAEFRDLLQTNLTVLATAHAVSEGIIRGVSGALARKRAPSTYGASGRALPLSPKASQPLALSRTL